MTEKNNSRRAFLATGLKALAVVLPIAAVAMTPEKAEARTWRRGRVVRRRYY